MDFFGGQSCGFFFADIFLRKKLRIFSLKELRIFFTKKAAVLFNVEKAADFFAEIK